MINTNEILIPESSYHVYNRANGSEKLFLSVENYQYFLQRYQVYISPIADTFCYCLMPNHFHFLIRIKKEAELFEFFSNKAAVAAGKNKATLQGFKTLEGFKTKEGLQLSKLLTQQFSHLFNGYTQAFNKQNNRKGSLFMHTFKRKGIRDRNYLLNLVHYIHFNPIESELCNQITEWEHSSYRKIISSENNFLRSSEVINWFEDLENFKAFHSELPKDLELMNKLTI